MKMKLDFVTNSSSASFIIPVKDLTLEQIILIYNHSIVGKLFIKDNEKYGWNLNDSDEWLLWENGDELNGETNMDNFDMMWFLEKIGVPKEVIQYEGQDR